VSFMHVDCDLYSSTKTVLNSFRRGIVRGTVILFDEIFGYEGFERYEYRAFMEFAREQGRAFETLARWNAFRAVVRIL
jgi:hypothetical protein